MDDETNFFNSSISTVDQDINAVENQNITINVPGITLHSPAPFVTYSGTEVPVVASVTVQDTDIIPFKKLFKYSFICIKVDNSTAYAGFPLFDIVGDAYKDSEMALALIPPQISGLPPGAHYVDVALSHPETMSVIPETNMNKEKLKFYTTGIENKDALVLVNITVDNATKTIGIMNGDSSSLNAQSKHFCDSIGNYENVMCNLMVLERLIFDWRAFESKNNARQVPS